jgi:hypothetical protein
MPIELKQKFDLLSENLNYNDEFWRPEKMQNVPQTSKQRWLNTSKVNLSNRQCMGFKESDNRCHTTMPTKGENEKGRIR